MTTCDFCMNQLRDRHKQWNDCLNGDDVNSISHQLDRMTRDITDFRVLLEAHQLASERDGNAKWINEFPFRLLHKCFSESLLLSFRRLMDGEGRDEKHGVYSLLSLLNDMIKHSHLLTREAVVRVTSENLEAESEQQDDEFFRDMETSRNRTIDRVIGVEEQNRSPSDVVPAKIFEEKRKELAKQFEPVKILVNKLVAHAATPTSRDNADIQPLIFEELYKFHEALCRTAHYIQDLILNTSSSHFLPTIEPSFEEFQKLSLPLISVEHIPKLEQRWQKFTSQYESWSETISP